MPARRTIPIKKLIKSALTELGSGTSGEITRHISSYDSLVPVQSVVTNIGLMKRNKILIADNTIKNRFVYKLRVPARDIISLKIQTPTFKNNLLNGKSR